MKLLNKQYSIEGFLRELYPKGKLWQFVYGVYLHFSLRMETRIVEDDWFISKELIFEKDTVLDIGANIGEFTIYVNSLNRTNNIIAFEPEKSAYEVLKHVTAGLKNINIFNYGLSNKNTTTTLYIPRIKSNTLSVKESSLHKEYILNKKLKSFSYKTELIRIFSLDDILRKLKVKSIDFIKLDTEGHELEILKGAYATIKKYKPIILVEIIFNRDTSKSVELLKLLRNLNYCSFKVINYSTIQEVKIDGIKNQNSNNYLFINKRNLHKYIRLIKVGYYKS